MTFTGWKPEEETQVPPERIPAVLAALHEGTVDPLPASWIVLGNLRCEMRSGQVVDIGLFFVDERELAFRTDAAHYFRGVDGSQLIGAVTGSKVAPGTGLLDTRRH